MDKFMLYFVIVVIILGVVFFNVAAIADIVWSVVDFVKFIACGA